MVRKVTLEKQQTLGTGGRSKLDLMTYRFSETGEVQDYDVYRFRAAAGVLPLDDDGNIYLIEEFAPGAEGWIIGLMRGGIEQGEDPAKAAYREAVEEGGVVCEKLEPLWTGLVAANVSDWKVHLFVGKQLKFVTREGGDERGEVSLRKIPLTEAVKMVQQGKVPTALTALAIMMVAEKN